MNSGQDFKSHSGQDFKSHSNNMQSPNLRYNTKKTNNFIIPTPKSVNRQNYHNKSGKNYAVSPSICSNISSYKEKTQNTVVSPNFSNNVHNSFELYSKEYNHNIKDVSNFSNKFDRNSEKYTYSKDYEAYNQNIGQYANNNMSEPEADYSVDMIEKGF